MQGRAHLRPHAKTSFTKRCYTPESSFTQLTPTSLNSSPAESPCPPCYIRARATFRLCYISLIPLYIAHLSSNTYPDLRGHESKCFFPNKPRSLFPRLDGEVLFAPSPSRPSCTERFHARAPMPPEDTRAAPRSGWRSSLRCRACACSHTEIHTIYKLDPMRFTTQNDIY